MLAMEQTSFVAVTGKAEVGKTTFAKAVIPLIPARKLCIYDFNGDYTEYRERCGEYYRVRYGKEWEAADFMRRIYNKGNIFAVFDECDLYFTNANDFLKQFVVTLRNRVGGALCIFKRSKSIRPDIRSRFDFLVVFQTSLPEDIKYIAEWTGYDPRELEFLKTLGKGEFVVFDIRKQEKTGPFRLNINKK